VIESHSQTLPAGTGTTMDLRKIARERTVILATTGSFQLIFECSDDGTNWARLPQFFSAAGSYEITAAAPYMRPKVLNGSGSGRVAVCGVPLKASEDAVTFIKGPDGGAIVEQFSTPFHRVNGDRVVADVSFFFQEAVTGHGTNNATIIVNAVAADGTVRGVVASLTTTANVDAQKTVGATLGAVVALQDGDWLVYEVVKNGTGVSLPLLSAAVRFQS